MKVGYGLRETGKAVKKIKRENTGYDKEFTTSFYPALCCS